MPDAQKMGPLLRAEEIEPTAQAGPCTRALTGAGLRAEVASKEEIGFSSTS
jgi:hypothetical protein